MEKIPKIHIETLTGESNWTSWKSDVLYTLSLLDYQSVIIGTGTADFASAGKDAVVKFIIETSVGTEEKEYLPSCATAKEMWDTLVSVYETDTENVLDIYNNMFEYSKSEEDSLVVHARKLTKICNNLNKELNTRGKIVLPQSFLINKILQTLPTEFQIAWESVSQNQRNVTRLIEELRFYEFKKSHEGSSIRKIRKRAANTQGIFDQIQTEIISDEMECALDDLKNAPPNIPFFCEQCCKVYENKKKYRRHWKAVHGEKKFSCSTCEKKFTYIQRLKYHEDSHSISKTYQVVCSLCGKGLSRPDKLRRHILRYHSENTSTRAERRPPKVSGKKRGKIERMSEEQLAKFEYKCEKCMVGYRRRGILVNHMAKHHPDISMDSEPCLAAPIFEMQKSFNCPYCWRVYMSHGKRKSHIEQKHPQNAHLRTVTTYVDTDELGPLKIDPRPCSLCPKQFLTNAKLLQHLRKEHRPVVVSENENELVA